MAQLINNLPVGSKIKLGKYQVETETPQDILWQIADKNNTSYPSNSITLITEKIIDLRGFDAKEPSNSDSDRQSYGNNRYRDSNIRQWLNKSGHPWYSDTHSADEPPTDAGTNNYGTGYEDKEGFLSNFTEMEVSALLDTTLTVALNTVTDGGGSETVVDKIFLASHTEVGLENENGIAEGSQFDLFTNDSSRISYLTEQAFNNTQSSSKPSSASGAWYWWLRSPSASHSGSVRFVSTSGALEISNAYNGSHGVRPLCNLNSEILVSDTTDLDGAYTIIWPNVISDNLQKINNKDFTWTVETIGEHTNVKSQLHIYDEDDNLIETGSVQSGIGTKSDIIIPSSAGDFKAKVKLWSDITQENWSNEINYTITVIPYVLTLDKTINIQVGEKLDKIKFDARVNSKNLKLKSMDNEKIIYEGEMLDADTVNLEIEGKDGKIDNIAYTII